MTKEIAAALREEFGLVGKLEFDKILPALGLNVKEVPAQGFEGALVRSRAYMRASVLIKQSIRERTRKRFTIAHEIGHYVLHQEQNRLSCGTADIEQWRDGDKNPEREADEFASELLLPTAELRTFVGTKWPSFALIEACSETFDVSLMATARKYVDVAAQSCAVVWSKDGVIRWAHRSGTFNYWVRVGQPLGEECLATKLPAAPGRHSEIEDVAAGEWLESNWLRGGATLKEESIFSPFYNGCLTLLWANRNIENKPTEEDELLAELDDGRLDSYRRLNWPGKC